MKKHTINHAVRRRMDLQLFAGAISGKKIIYLYRVLEDAATDDAAVMAFVTENETSISKDADATVTKDGTVRTPNAAEIEITATSLFAKGDTLCDKMKQAMLQDKKMEVWEVNLAEPVQNQSNKFKATYYQGYLTEFTKTSSAEDHVEISITFGVEGNGADGSATVTTEQQEIAAYVFADTQKTGA